VQSGYYKILVIARITDKSGLRCRIARQIFKQAAAFNLELDRICTFVKLRSRSRAARVNGIQIKKGRATKKRACDYLTI
jgi:hypothetical protein